MDKYIDFFNNYTKYYISIAKNEFQKLHISRKIEHSKRVNKLSLEIATKLELNSKEIYLINIASLLHDIGRFKQFYEYNTYIDNNFYNHATEGIKILEQEHLLDELELSDKKIILEIIKLHNYKELPENISNKLYIYASIIRDADKIDWIYSMVNIIPNLSKKDQAVFYSNKDEKNLISEKLVNSILNNEVVIKDELNTIDELRIASLGWITAGVKCKASDEIIIREDLINKAYKLIPNSINKQKVFDYVNCCINNQINERKY